MPTRRDRLRSTTFLVGIVTDKRYAPNAQRAAWQMLTPRMQEHVLRLGVPLCPDLDRPVLSYWAWYVNNLPDDTPWR